ncbi:hypothetical protein [Aquabacterium sp.]|uniref:hypothetical protein n=1 Tax=Aquabacterium sp. TaxID=1872578 RepID=UPI003D6CFA26
MKRIFIVLLYLLVGIGIDFLPMLIAPNGCRETCPDWFSLYSLALLALIPIGWFCAGLVASKPSNKIGFKHLLLLLAFSVSLVVATAVLSEHYQKTSSYGAVSG